MSLGCLQATGNLRTGASFSRGLSLKEALISAGLLPLTQLGSLASCLSRSTRPGYLGFFSFFFSFLTGFLPPSSHNEHTEDCDKKSRDNRGPQQHTLLTMFAFLSVLAAKINAVRLAPCQTEQSACHKQYRWARRQPICLLL